MRKFIIVILLLVSCTNENHSYKGKFCSGEGDTNYLRLIDESFAYFHPNPVLPNLTFLYKSEWDSFAESPGWNAWWTENIYGFSYSATPFPEEPGICYKKQLLIMNLIHGYENF